MALHKTKSRWSKIPERFVFVTSPFVYAWLFVWSFGPANNWGSYGCMVETNAVNQTIDYYNGCVLGLWVFPILLGTSYLMIGIFKRRDRIKKEKLL